MFDRNSLQIIGPSARPPDVENATAVEVQDQQDAKEELETFEAPSIQVLAQNDGKCAINAEDTSFEGISYQKNLPNMMETIEEADGIGKLAFVETNCKELPVSFNENEGRTLNTATKYKELLCVSGEKIYVQQGLKESLDLQEMDKEDISKQHDEQSNRHGTFDGQGGSKQRLKLKKNCCKLDDGTKPRLRGGGAKKEKIKIRYFESKMEEFNIILNLLRSSGSIDGFNKHTRCKPSLLCSFCLLRSLMFKIKNPKGRPAVIPVEIECQRFSSLQPVSSLLDQLMIKVIASYPDFKNAISPTWYCTCCSKNVDFGDGCFINLNQEIKNTKLDDLIRIKFNSLLEDHREEQSIDGGGTMQEKHETR